MSALMPDVLELPRLPVDPERNCPFYGRALVFAGRPFTLLGTGGNQCAIIIDRHSPCALEIDNQPVDWRTCPRIALLEFAMK